MGSKLFEWYKFCFSGLVFFFVFAPKIDRFLVVSCDVLKPCEESVTIIDGGCARFARGVWCKIFIILAYSQYRRYKYSSCTPPGCYEICCYLFSEGTLMRPPVIAEVSPPGNTYKYGRFLSSEERSARMRILRSTLHITLKYIVIHAQITLHQQPPVHTKHRYTSCAPHTPEGLSLW